MIEYGNTGYTSQNVTLISAFDPPMKVNCIIYFWFRLFLRFSY